MFTVKFEFREDKEYGGEGWIPVERPTFNAASGFALVHDVLEHFPEDDSDLAGEMKAFGSMINIRWMSGWFPLDGYSRYSPAVNMGADFGMFLRDMSYNADMYLRNPKRTYRLHDEFEEMLDEAFAEAKRVYMAELYEEDKPRFNGYDMQEIFRKMRGWMRIGYRQSVKRFYNAKHYDLSYLFTRMEQCVKKVRGEFGQILTVNVHPRRLDFSMNVAYPYEYD